MKHSLFVLIPAFFVSVILISCSPKNSSADQSNGVVSNADSAGGSYNKDALPVISFESDFHDFGRLSSGEKVTYAFKFKNTGKSLLIISNVSTSCGCTVSAFPKQPLKPGEGATIDVSFDSEGRHGMQSKMITVFSNTEPPTTTLRIQSQVVEPEDI